VDCSCGASCCGGVGGNQNGLGSGGVGGGEINVLLALLGDGEAGHAEVNLAGNDSCDNGVKLHIFDLQLNAQLFAHSLSDLNVDADDFAGLIMIILIGREVTAGTHGQGLGHSGSRQHQSDGHQDSDNLLHVLLPLF
jgi:hypothetical protein